MGSLTAHTHRVTSDLSIKKTKKPLSVCATFDGGKIKIFFYNYMSTTSLKSSALGVSFLFHLTFKRIYITSKTSVSTARGGEG